MYIEREMSLHEESEIEASIPFSFLLETLA